MRARGVGDAGAAKWERRTATFQAGGGRPSARQECAVRRIRFPPARVVKWSLGGSRLVWAGGHRCVCLMVVAPRRASPHPGAAGHRSAYDVEAFRNGVAAGFEAKRSERSHFGSSRVSRFGSRDAFFRAVRPQALLVALAFQGHARARGCDRRCPHSNAGLRRMSTTQRGGRRPRRGC